MLFGRFTLGIALVGALVLAEARDNRTLTPREEKVLGDWLRRHPTYRLAADDDCDCTDDVMGMRTGYNGTMDPVPDYHPYQAKGDFNGDGFTDCAAVLIELPKTTDRFALIVFNGPFPAARPASPAFLRAGLDLKGKGLFFFGPPPPKRRLVVGVFESEGVALVPRGGTYALDWVR